MTDFHDTDPDSPLTPEAEAQASLLTAADLRRIDECLLSHTSYRWQKVARVVGQTMLEIHREFPELPDVFYSLRIKHLVASGTLEADGDLSRMRYRGPHPGLKTRGLSMRRMPPHA